LCIATDTDASVGVRPQPFAEAKLASMWHSDSSSAPCIRQFRQCGTDYLPLAPLLKATVHRLVVGIELWKHAPLSAGVENRQHRLKHLACWDRLAAWTLVGVVLLRKMLPDQLPLRVRYA